MEFKNFYKICLETLKAGNLANATFTNGRLPNVKLTNSFNELYIIQHYYPIYCINQ